MNDSLKRPWRELAADWRVWVFVALAFVVATIASLLGYD
jgi:hypothetical protein